MIRVYGHQKDIAADRSGILRHQAYEDVDLLHERLPLGLQFTIDKLVRGTGPISHFPQAFRPTVYERSVEILIAEKVLFGIFHGITEFVEELYVMSADLTGAGKLSEKPRDGCRGNSSSANGIKRAGLIWP